MSPRVLQYLSKLVPNRVTHRWNNHKVLAAFAAVLIVMALLPIPKDLRNIFADAPDPALFGVADNYIVVDDATSDIPAGVAIDCNLETSTTPTNDGDCSLRDAVQLAEDERGGTNVDPIYILFDTDIEEISLMDSITIAVEDLHIIGNMGDDNLPSVVLTPDAAFVSATQADCSVISPTDGSTLNAPHAPLVDIMVDNVELAQLAFVNAEGNAIQASGASGLSIHDNLIGTRDRATIEANTLHGICITTAIDIITNVNIYGNIIVGSGNDGIRLEGVYGYNKDDSEVIEQYYVAANIYNNLIGTFDGAATTLEPEDADFPGNHYSGIAARLTLGGEIKRNIIVNNGFTDIEEDSDFDHVGDGITLLETLGIIIYDNFIGVTPNSELIDANGINDTFPLPVDGNELLDISVAETDMAPSAFERASNACDGIGIRYFDAMGDQEYFCRDEDTLLAERPDSVLDLFPLNAVSTIDEDVVQNFLGPSNSNAIYNNAIGYNQRNGIYIQTLACNTTLGSAELAHNLPNILGSNDDGVARVQSQANTIIQNTIFANDANLGDQTATGSGSYGIGIDLEDYATAIWSGAADEITGASVQGGDYRPSYWAYLFAHLDEATITTRFGCEDADNTPTWEPIQTNTDIDFNITENDATDSGEDPDAGANRLINAPIIDGPASTMSSITGTAPEGTLVELFAVDCTDLTGSDRSAEALRSGCDVDYSEDDIDEDATDHPYGHGQGFRFLGNAYVEADADADYEGKWTINPASFTNSGNYGVEPFIGGLVVATSTAVTNNTDELIESVTRCWDAGTDTDNIACDANIIAASVPTDISAQEAGVPGVGTTGSGGIWATDGDDGLENICQYVTDTFSDVPTESVLSCLGSTSEFSASAFISRPNYSLTKQLTSGDTTVAPGDTVSYVITAENTGNGVLYFGTGSLSDPLSTSLTLATCEWATENADGDPIDDGNDCSGTDNDIINTTDFGSLNPTEVITILVTATVNTGLEGAACDIENEVFVGDGFITDDNQTAASQSGSVDADHQADDIGVVPCAGSTLEKQVAIGSSTSYTNADNTGTGARDSARGDAVNYLIHFTNNSGSSTGVLITDTFPATLALTSRAVTCWINTTATDTSIAGDTAISGCRYDSSSGEFDENSSGDHRITLADGETVHILVTGYSINANHAINNNFICNTATATASGITLLSDQACVRVYDPALDVFKSVSIGGAAESSFNSGTTSSTWPTAPVGQSVTYYIDVANAGTGASLTNLAVTDTLPTALNTSTFQCSYTTGSGSISTTASHTGITYGSTCTMNGSGVITTGVTTLGAGSLLRIRLNGVNVPNVTATTQLCNAISVTAALVATDTDSACARVVVPGITLSKSVSSTAPTPGSTVTYTLLIANNGSSTANDLVITDDLDDADLDNNLIPDCVASFANVTALNSGVKNNGTNTITWTIGSLTAGSSTAVAFTAVIRSDIATSTECRNTALADGSNVTSTDDSVDIVVPAAIPSGALLGITKVAVNDDGGSDDPTVFELGDAVNYRVTVRNTGDTQALNLSVQDSIPNAEEDLRNVTTTAGTVNTTAVSDDEVEITGMSVAADGSQTINYTVSIVEDDFPLRNYRLDEDAEQDDDQFYPERVRNDDVTSTGTHSDAEDALAAPDDEYVSLGADGEIILDVASRRSGATKLIVDGDGNDFCIRELDQSEDTDRADERYTVEVSQTTRSRDFERVGRNQSNSGCFDIGDADITWARYIRIQDTSTQTAGEAPGVDVDAVCLLNLGGFVTNTAGLYQGTTLLGTVDERVLVNFTEAFEEPLRARDCRSEAVVQTAAPLPPPPPAPYVPPVNIPIQLPKTGPLEAGIPPMVGTGGLMSMWWMWRRKIEKS
ncbi:MAG: DUF11 domain-containing protein [Candidatus Abawacabacteria bacterium]|nr:DUF11 domain-containing protein [Candidatus Abawacabacteria bacterium]